MFFNEAVASESESVGQSEQWKGLFQASGACVCVIIFLQFLCVLVLRLSKISSQTEKQIAEKLQSERRGERSQARAPSGLDYMLGEAHSLLFEPCALSKLFSKSFTGSGLFARVRPTNEKPLLAVTNQLTNHPHVW